MGHRAGRTGGSSHRCLSSAVLARAAIPRQSLCLSNKESARFQTLADTTPGQGRAAAGPKIAQQVQEARTIEVRAHYGSITHIERQLVEEWRLST